MLNKKAPVYSNKKVFNICGHGLKVVSIEDNPFGFVYRLSCRPHCCTHPNGIEVKVSESLLVEMVQKRIAETKFMGLFVGKCSGFIKKHVFVHTC